jgi:hypothetical protein
MVGSTEVQGLHPRVGRSGFVGPKRSAALELRRVPRGSASGPDWRKRGRRRPAWAAGPGQRCGRTAHTRRYIRRASSVFSPIGTGITEAHASPAVALHTGTGGHRPLVADRMPLSAEPRDTLRALARNESRSRLSQRACHGSHAPDCPPTRCRARTAHRLSRADASGGQNRCVRRVGTKNA